MTQENHLVDPDFLLKEVMEKAPNLAKRVAESLILDPIAGGTKYDGEKPRMDLLDPAWMEDVASVLTFGASKYTREETKNCLVDIVEEILKFTPEDYVKLATTQATNGRTLRFIILTKENTDVEIKRNLMSGGALIWLPILMSWKPKGEILSKSNMDYQTMNLIISLHNLVAAYVEALSNCALITITKQEELERDFVKPVTLLLDSLREMNGQLKLKSIYNDGVERISGAHNWRGGINASRLIAAAYRHLGAINKGEDIDPESGLPHSAHLSCCIMFLHWMLANRKDLDDRWKKQNG